MDKSPHKPFNVFLSDFSLCPVHLPENIVFRHDLEAPKQVFTGNALKPQLPQSKKEVRTAEKLDSSDEESSLTLGADPEQWR